MVVYSGAVPVVGPRAPYITPDVLRTAPTGISWDTIPELGADAEEQQAALLDICMRATAEAEGVTTQPLRSTLDSETLYGPSYRVTLNQHNGVGRVLLSRWPVTDVLQVMTSATSAFPAQWVTLPTDRYRVESPLLGVYDTPAPGAAGDSGGQAILIAPGYLSTAYGEAGTMIQVTYVNGWPHSAITADAQESDTTLVVDDCTGWFNTTANTGAVGILDSGTTQEVVACKSASASSGPGILTLVNPLVNKHSAGVLVSTLPTSVGLACIYFATAEALVRGATATTVQMTPGHSAGGGGELDPGHLITEAEVLLAPFKRII